MRDSATLDGSLFGGDEEVRAVGKLREGRPQGKEF
jgi:hypothetical protein